MDGNYIIYGLDANARALAPQIAETNEIRFFIASQSLKSNNQLYLIELDEETSSLNTRIFTNPLGEVWKLNASPHDKQCLVCCYGKQKDTENVIQSAIIKLPDNVDNIDKSEYLTIESIESLETNNYGVEVKTTEFHPTDAQLLATIVDNKILLHQRAESSTQVITEICTKNAKKMSTGKWSQHHQGNQFISLYDCSIRSYDIRDPAHPAWTIDDAHGEYIRDLDCNPNKQCHLVTGGDDGLLKVWDCRNFKEALFTRNDHSHWIWNVRFNTFHDQLILSSSSDCKVMLTSACSVSSEAGDESGEQKEKISNGLLQTLNAHEDSVYCVEWSSVDPWIFASLSYDGRVIISRVSKELKYKILL